MTIKSKSSNNYNVPMAVATVVPKAVTTPVPVVQKQKTAASSSSKLLTIEAELSKTLNISWADARELSAYARGTLSIIPGDKNADIVHRQAIVRAAIEADKSNPKKRVVSKPKPKVSEEERMRQERIQKGARKLYRMWSIMNKNNRGGLHLW